MWRWNRRKGKDNGRRGEEDGSTESPGHQIFNKKDEQHALALFKHDKKRPAIVLSRAIFMGVSGFLLLVHASYAFFVIAGFAMILGGVSVGLGGVCLLYRCPVCGYSLLTIPGDPGCVQFSIGVIIYPPPASCPNCDTPLH
jgi:hypothetical protein